MKKVIFLFAALMAVFSCIAAVSAYEGHMVDVKAHVENAIMVETYEVDFGITFPEAKVETQFQIGLSESFLLQQRYSSVDYCLYWEAKPVGDHEVALDDPQNEGFFIPIWPLIDVQVDGVDYPIADYEDGPNGTILIGCSSMNVTDTCDWIHFSFDPPVFDKWYNELTDPRTPSGILGPDYYVEAEETADCGFTAMVPHTDLGSNFKIQVVDIYGD